MKSRQVGESITARFNGITGSVELYANNGVLWNNWVERLGIRTSEIKSIRVAEGIVFLPKDASGFNLEKWYYTMFGGLTNAELIDLSNFDTSKVTDMRCMFCECKALKELDLSSFNTSSVTDMSGMFYRCGGLTDLDLSGFDTSNVTEMDYIFDGCGNLPDCSLDRIVGRSATGFFRSDRSRRRN